MALTNKQRQFVDAKARGASNKEAAEAAGYAASTASAAGARLAKHPEIVAALEMLKQARNVNAALASGSATEADLLPSGESAGADGEYLSCIPFTEDPLEWLLALMNEPRAKVFDRRSAAQKAVDYFHGKKGEQGKKEQKQNAAEKAAGSGRFGLREPRLKAVK